MLVRISHISAALRFRDVGVGHQWVHWLERHDLVSEQGLKQALVHLLWLSEVLVVDITGACWVDPDEIILAVVLNKCVAEHVSETRVHRRYLFDGAGFL